MKFLLAGLLMFIAIPAMAYKPYDPNQSTQSNLTYMGDRIVCDMRTRDGGQYWFDGNITQYSVTYNNNGWQFPVTVDWNNFIWGYYDNSHGYVEWSYNDLHKNMVVTMEDTPYGYSETGICYPVR